MTIVKKGDNASHGLNYESFGDSIEDYSIEELIECGSLVKVTSWTNPTMGFGRVGVRINAAVTVRLWRAIVSVPPFCRSWQTIRQRGNEVLWIAAWAMKRARERGKSVARFPVFLPTTDDDETSVKALQVESRFETDRRWVVIRHVEEYSICV